MTPTPEMPMTPEERAHQIISCQPFGTTVEQAEEFCAAQIREAEKEARKDAFQAEGWDKCMKEAKQQGFNAAKEKAAEIVQFHYRQQTNNEIADRIRQMEAE